MENYGLEKKGFFELGRRKERLEDAANRVAEQGVSADNVKKLNMPFHLAKTTQKLVITRDYSV